MAGSPRRARQAARGDAELVNVHGLLVRAQERGEAGEVLLLAAVRRVEGGHDLEKHGERVNKTLFDAR